jgi:hypothetical protein
VTRYVLAFILTAAVIDRVYAVTTQTPLTWSVTGAPSTTTTHCAEEGGFERVHCFESCHLPLPVSASARYRPRLARPAAAQSGGALTRPILSNEPPSRRLALALITRP